MTTKDLKKDPENCGMCHLSCKPSDVCVSGSCVDMAPNRKSVTYKNHPQKLEPTDSIFPMLTNHRLVLPPRKEVAVMIKPYCAYCEEVSIFPNYGCLACNIANTTTPFQENYSNFPEISHNISHDLNILKEEFYPHSRKESHLANIIDSSQILQQISSGFDQTFQKLCCNRPNQHSYEHNIPQQPHDIHGETSLISSSLFTSPTTNPSLIANFQYPDFEPENNEEAFVRSSNLHEALSRISQQTSLFNVINHTDPDSLLDRYLHSNPLIAETMLFPTQETFLSEIPNIYSLHVLVPYFKWSVALKVRLSDFFKSLIEVWRELIKTKSAKHVTLAKAFPINPDQQSFSWNEVRDIYLAYVAHSLLVEITELVPWRLHEYSKESLLLLFSAENTIVNAAHLPSSTYHSIAGRNNGKPFYVGHKIQFDSFPPQLLVYETCPINPIQIFIFLEERNLINRTGFPVHPLETGLNKVAGDISESLLGSNTKAEEGLKSSMHQKGFSLYSWRDDQTRTLNSRMIKRTLSIICRWFMYNVSHSDSYGLYFPSTSWTVPPIDRCLSLPISEKRKLIPDISTRTTVLRQVVDYYEWIPLAIQNKLSNHSNIFYDKDRNPPSYLEMKNGLLQLTWCRYSAFSGCHGASGMLYWMLRSLNISSQIITTYQNIRNTINPNPNNGHRGIVVFVPKKIANSSDEGLYLYHLDKIYADGNSRDPLIDPINHFVDEKTFSRWFYPPLRTITARFDFDFFAELLNMKHTVGLTMAYCSVFGVETILKNFYDTYDGKIWLTKKEFLEIRKYISEILSFRTDQIRLGQNLPLGYRKSPQYYSDWDNFYRDRYSYIKNIIGILTEHPIKETKTI